MYNVFFVDYSNSIEKGLKRFLNNISFQHHYSSYNQSLIENKKQYQLKKEQEQKRIELEELKREKYFDFKIERFNKNEF